MAAEIADLKARATEFASTADATITLALADAALQINRTNWGSKADLGTIYLAAHILKVWELQSAAAAGPVTKLKDGDLAVEFGFASSSPDLSSYAATIWGREYLALRDQIFSMQVL